MLATLFHGRGPVLGISLAVAWSGPIQQHAPWLYDILPWKLLIDFNAGEAPPGLAPTSSFAPQPVFSQEPLSALPYAPGYLDTMEERLRGLGR